MTYLRNASEEDSVKSVSDDGSLVTAFVEQDTGAEIKDKLAAIGFGDIAIVGQGTPTETLYIKYSKMEMYAEGARDKKDRDVSGQIDGGKSETATMESVLDALQEVGAIASKDSFAEEARRGHAK